MLHTLKFHVRKPVDVPPAWILTLLLLVPVAGQANDKITFGLDWKAEAEYGGYYQALATGLYAKHGLDVVIQQGGPQVNHTQLLLAGRLDFNITGNAFMALNFVKEQHPVPCGCCSVPEGSGGADRASRRQGNDSFACAEGQADHGRRRHAGPAGGGS